MAWVVITDKRRITLKTLIITWNDRRRWPLFHRDLFSVCLYFWFGYNRVNADSPQVQTWHLGLIKPSSIYVFFISHFICVNICILTSKPIQITCRYGDNNGVHFVTSYWSPAVATGMAKIANVSSLKIETQTTRVYWSKNTIGLLYTFSV